ncbi:MAG: sulfatase-like hydrolase/transferase [Polyangiales bacterium]
MSRLAKLRALLFGERPRLILCFVAPTLVAVAMDLCIRARAIASYSWLDRLNYFGSTLASAGFWGGSLWLVSRLFLVESGHRRTLARAAIAAWFLGVVMPLTVFSFGGQALYHAVFHAYMARDTVRLGMQLRGTLRDWLADWGGVRAAFAMLVPGLLLTTLFAWLTRKAAPSFKRADNLVPMVGLAVASTCFWIDFVESRTLQAAPPDTCFIHGVVHALRDRLTGKGWIRRGISRRIPDALPTLAPPTHRPNILLVVTESVRADALCSDPRDGCAAPLLDTVAADRRALGRLTSQAPGTFSACVMLWTGLPPTADFATMHRAPVLWELAKAIGYRTAYVTSQNLRYDDFVAYTQRAAIDVRITADEIGAFHQQLGAKDEVAAQKLVETVASFGDATPWFAVLHLSNTHAPYRIDPDLQPFQPASDDPLGDLGAFKNHYLNSIRLQERTLTETLRALEAMPSWSDTVVVFVSDHGEEFREHGGLYHLRTLYDEQLRVPGWLLAGARVLDDQQRASLDTWSHRRTYSNDVNATLLDLLGLYDRRQTLPLSASATGRSLLRPATIDEPIVPLASASGVWEPLDMVYGAMQGDHLLCGAPAQPWRCFDGTNDPGEHRALSPDACGGAMNARVAEWFVGDFGRR